MSTSVVKYFRPVRPGPEAKLEAAVARSIEQFVTPSTLPRWLAGSLPIGAGMPDLLAISWNPRVVAIANSCVQNSAILAYLRAVGCARFETIVSRLRQRSKTVAEGLTDLVRAAVILESANCFSLDPDWKFILPEVVAVEAKMTDWRKAITQAARNQLFSHRSFVALPSNVAERIASTEPLQRQGIGVLAVHRDGTVTVARKAVRQHPKVWVYYYQLAHHVAQAAQPAAAVCLSSSH